MRPRRRFGVIGRHAQLQPCAPQPRHKRLKRHRFDLARPCRKTIEPAQQFRFCRLARHPGQQQPGDVSRRTGNHRTGRTQTRQFQIKIDCGRQLCNQLFIPCGQFVKQASSPGRPGGVEVKKRAVFVKQHSVKYAHFPPCLFCLLIAAGRRRGYGFKCTGPSETERTTCRASCPVDLRAPGQMLARAHRRIISQPG